MSVFDRLTNDVGRPCQDCGEPSSKFQTEIVDGKIVTDVWCDKCAPEELVDRLEAAAKEEEQDFCQSCGACCVSSIDDDRYVELTDKDVERLSSYYQRKHVVKEEFRGAIAGIPRYTLKTKRDKEGNIVCVALRGKIGQHVTCMIYDRRPDICRQFKPGGKQCDDTREELGFSV